MPGQPILAGSPDNPAGQVSRIRKAWKVTRQHLAAVQRWLFAEIDAIPTAVANADRYEYQIDLGTLRRISQEMALRLDDEAVVQAVIAQIMAAYEEGTGQTNINLSTITDDYTRTITQVLSSQPYLRRTALIRSRVFEEMKGFSGETGQELARVLSQAVENGLNPRTLKADLAERFGVSQSRAERIARTEITGALRRARWDEAQDAQEKLGLNIGMLWRSALSPTTRASHADRHALVYDVQEVREFYSRDGNQIHCKCSQLEVVLDEDGNPTSPRVVEKLQEQKSAFEKRQTAA